MLFLNFFLINRQGHKHTYTHKLIGLNNNHCFYSCDCVPLIEEGSTGWICCESAGLGVSPQVSLRPAQDMFIPGKKSRVENVQGMLFLWQWHFFSGIDFSNMPLTKVSLSWASNPGEEKHTLSIILILTMVILCVKVSWSKAQYKWSLEVEKCRKSDYFWTII